MLFCASVLGTEPTDCGERRSAPLELSNLDDDDNLLNCFTASIVVFAHGVGGGLQETITLDRGGFSQTLTTAKMDLSSGGI